MRRRRLGFTLVEMMAAVVIIGIIATGLTKLLRAQGRFFDHETNLRTARSVARGSMNVLLSDLRMVQDSGGVDSVTADGKLIRILVPYRFGLVCGTNGNTTTVSMLPADSGTVAMSVYTGFAWRDTASGRYHYIQPANPTTSDIPVTSASPATCTGNGGGQAQIRTVTGNGRTGNLLDLPGEVPSGATVAAPMFLWQRITYSFRASGVYPGRVGLWRNVQGGRNEELLAPFDTSAGFRFYKAGDDTSRVAPPLVSDIRGVDIVLSARSPRGTSSDTSTARSAIVTSVFFKNVRAF